MSKRYRLVATDLDGTLLRDAPPASPRTVEALRAVQATGAYVVPVTARPPRTAAPLAAEYGIHGWAVCGSGSILFDLADQAIVDDHVLDAEVALRLVTAMRSAMPGILFAAERHMQFIREPGFGHPPTIPDNIDQGDAGEWARTPVTKLIARHPDHPADRLIEAMRAELGLDAEVGHSGAGTWIEVLGQGASKAAMLDRLCGTLTIAPDEVIAFGDWTIDIPLLQWAGHGVAMANALPEVKAVADEIAPSNEEDGVAQVLERLLEEDRVGS